MSYQFESTSRTIGVPGNGVAPDGMNSVIDSRQLRAFEVLARTGKFTIAAQELSLTQSAVSHAIRSLEEDLECRLFERTGRGAVLTPAGRRFLDYVSSILTGMGIAREAVGRTLGRPQARLRISGTPQFGQLIMPAVLTEFNRQFPHQPVTGETGPYDWQLEMVRMGRLDLAFTHRPLSSPDLAFELLVEDELCFAVSPTHPWTRKSKITREDIAQVPLIVYSKIARVTERMGEFADSMGLPRNRCVAVPSAETIHELVQSGAAVGMLVPCSIRNEIEKGTLVVLPLTTYRLPRQWGAIYLRNRKLTMREETLIQITKVAMERFLAQLRGATAFRESVGVALLALTQSAELIGGMIRAIA